MDQVSKWPEVKGYVPQILAWLLDLLSAEAVGLLLKLLKSNLFLPVRSPGLYEVLNYHATLELKDSHGQTAIYRKRTRIRFLKDNVSTFYDYGWGTGDAFVGHRVQPGHVVERKKIGQRYRSLVVLPEPQHKGDELTL